jgi:EpsI family protein
MLAPPLGKHNNSLHESQQLRMNTDSKAAKRFAPFSASWNGLSAHHAIVFQISLLAAALLFVYYHTFEWLLQVWLTTDRYSHGFLIPLIAAYLVWIKRDHLAQPPRRPNLVTGGLLLIASTMLLLAGRAGGSVLAEAISLLFFLPGVVLVIWGPSHLRTLMFPLGYLQFMIPWTEVFFVQAAWPFQLLSARLASLLLQAIGISVFREATYLQFPHVTINVVAGCSGLSLLYSIMALSIPLAYLTQRTWWRAAGVLVFAATITILANGVRVALMGAVGSYSGGSSLHGLFHLFQGWFVAQAAILSLFLANWGVAKLPCDSQVRLFERRKGVTADVPSTSTLLPRVTGSSVLLALSLLVLGYTFRQAWFMAQLVVVVFFLLVVILWAVMKFRGVPTSLLYERSTERPAGIAAVTTRARAVGPSALLLVALMGFGFYLNFFASPSLVTPRKPLATLPNVIDNWQGRHSTWIDGGRYFPGADAEAVRTYQTTGKVIFLYIGYFNSQRPGVSLVSDRAKPIRLDARELTLPRASAGLEHVNHSVPTIDGKRYEALFWYRLPSGNTTGRYETTLRRFLDAAVRGHNNGAVVVLATPASEKQSGTPAVDDLLGFATVLAPVLEEYLP